MSRYLFHPKALPVSNIVEGFFEEMREKNELVYFREQTQRKAVLYELESVKPNEGQAVSPAAPFNPQLFKTGMLVLFDCFIAAFDLYWILRIFL